MPHIEIIKFCQNHWSLIAAHSSAMEYGQVAILLIIKKSSILTVHKLRFGQQTGKTATNETLEIPKIPYSLIQTQSSTKPVQRRPTGRQPTSEGGRGWGGRSPSPWGPPIRITRSRTGQRNKEQPKEETRITKADSTFQKCGGEGGGATEARSTPRYK